MNYRMVGVERGQGSTVEVIWEMKVDASVQMQCLVLQFVHTVCCRLPAESRFHEALCLTEAGFSD